MRYRLPFRPFRPRRLPVTQPAFRLDADAVEVLDSTAAFRIRLLALIRAARSRIHIAALYLQEDEGGQEILDALYAAKAAQPGLDIRVFVDWHRARRGLVGQKKHAGNAAWYQAQAALHEASVPIYGVPVQTREIFGVFHLKGFVIDDTVIYSGASLNNVYLDKLGQYRYDRYHLIRQRDLAQAMSAWMTGMLSANPAVRRLDQPTLPDPAHNNRIRQFRAQLEQSQYALAGSTLSEDGGLSITPYLGLGKRNRLNRLILQLVEETSEHLTLCTPYFNLPTLLEQAIASLLRRGRTVTLIVGAKTANDFYIPPDQPFKSIGALPYLYEIRLRRFARQQQTAIDRQKLHIRLWQHDHHTYHLKGMWVDDRYQLLTGNNLNPRAFRLDLENALLIHDPDNRLQASREAELARILAHTSRIDHYSALETPHDYPPKVRQLLRRLGPVGIHRLLYRLL